ncbi:hypothetical protein SESBI_50692 [Sesbania bispinosa]|nr:hypothetical protein SESBI_50692 [Sesbania bispinosa]
MKLPDPFRDINARGPARPPNRYPRKDHQGLIATHLPYPNKGNVREKTVPYKELENRDECYFTAPKQGLCSSFTLEKLDGKRWQTAGDHPLFIEKLFPGGPEAH